MQNRNTHFKKSGIMCTKRFLFTLATLVALQFYAAAQTKFTLSTFNSSYVPISIGGGATSSIATGDNANETGIPIGFNFGYADSTFSVVGLNTNGLVWFDPVAPSGAGSYNNAYMVTNGGANQCLAPWFTNLIDDASSDILYQTQGAPGSQTFTIQYTNYPTALGVQGSNVRMNCQVILYEGSNIVEFRYGSLNIIGAQTTSFGGMIAIEWGSGGSGKFIDAVTGSSIVNNRMLSPFSGWPSYNFRFTPGIPAPIAAGTYNVGIGQTYNSLTRAIADANHRGLAGAVTFNLTDAQYDTTVANGSNIFPLFVATPNGSATNTLTISKTGAPATIAYRGSSVVFSGAGWGTGTNLTAFDFNQEPIIGVCASFTTITNVNLITHGAPQTVNVGLAQTELFGHQGAQNNFYDKISVDLDRNHGGVYGFASWSTTSPGGFAGTNSNNTWRDLNIKDCNVGISLNAPNNATGGPDQGNQIITSSCSTFNYIGDANTPDDISGGGAAGIAAGGQYNLTVRNCIIQNLTGTTTTGDVDGVVIWDSWGTIEVSNNIVHTLRRSNTGLNSAHWVSGIRLSWGNKPIHFKIFNNSISNLLSSYTGAPTTIAAIVGLYFQSNTGTVTSEVYNNSVSLDGSTFPNAASVCFSYNGIGANLQLKNNVFANFTTGQTGVANHGCFYTNSSTSYGNISSLADYNNYYLPDTTNGYLCRATTTSYLTLAAWQAAMTNNPGTDANSIVANPNFANNATDLHPTNASVSLDGTGTTPPLYITTDLDCKTRTAPHDIGCYHAGCWAEGGTITPNAVTICAKQTYIVSVTGHTTYPGVTYQWQQSTTAGGPYSNVTDGSGATTPTYTTGKLTTGTYYYVLKVTCPAVLFDYSSELQIEVKPLPKADITAGGDIVFCSGGNVQLDATTGANRSYQWKKGSNDIAGATLPTFIATTSGSYKVIVTNTISGCSKSSNKIEVTANPLPSAAITALGPLTFCAGDSVMLQASTVIGYTYKWKLGPNFIAGATASSYTAKLAGTYRVEVTTNSGCSKLSGSKKVKINCRDFDDMASLAINVYPNPATDEITIENIPEGNYEIEITDALGKVVSKAKNQNVYTVSDYSPGVYFIKIANAQEVITQRFSKK